MKFYLSRIELLYKVVPNIICLYLISDIPYKIENTQIMKDMKEPA